MEESRYITDREADLAHDVGAALSSEAIRTIVEQVDVRMRELGEPHLRTPTLMVALGSAMGKIQALALMSFNHTELQSYLSIADVTLATAKEALMEQSGKPN